MISTRIATTCGTALVFCLLFQADGSIQESLSSDSDIRAKLAFLNPLIGSWRGVGQIKRGSRNGAWTEKTTVEWDFKSENPAVEFKTDGGKQFRTLRLQYDPNSKQIQLSQLMGETTVRYSGKVPEQWPSRMELISLPDKRGHVHRCTIQQLSEKRATVLLEKRTSATGTFRRVAAVGYTRSGTRLAEVGGGARKCIVTGGLGTIPVTHKGKTYYVCCQGCVQAFNDSPDDIIAEYKESLSDGAP